MTNNYIIAIPSYKRANFCNTKTLTTLADNKINPKLIYIYVASKEEFNEYKSILNPNYYNKIIIGKKGLVPQRQFIMNNWSFNQKIVFFDDDVESIDLSLTKLPISNNLNKFINYAFECCIKHKSYIWGVYPVFNPFFREKRQEMTTNLNYIVGAFYGIISRPKLKSIQLIITNENGQKEDVERSLKYFINDGIVLRFNRIGFTTKYYGKEGGLGRFEERLKPMLNACKELERKYSDYGYIKTRPNGMSEFVLKKIPAFSKLKNDKNINKKSKKQIIKNKIINKTKKQKIK